MKEKDLDAVQMMREIRDRLSKKFAKMSFTEQKAYLDEKLRMAKLRRQKRKHRGR